MPVIARVSAPSQGGAGQFAGDGDRAARHRSADHRHQGKRALHLGTGAGQGACTVGVPRATLPILTAPHFEPFIPGWGFGVVGASASIFFAYVGFDAVSTAAEETVNPQRNVPIGLIGCLLFCTIFYLLVAAGAIGAIGADPVLHPAGTCSRGSPERRLRRRRRLATAGLLERSAGPCPALDRLSTDRRSDGRCRLSSLCRRWC